MNTSLIFVCLIAYFIFLFVIAWYTSRNASNKDYFVGGRSSRWYIVAYGMVGTSLSGVTFISVPGKVGTAHFAYFQVVLGYLIGYFVVAYILLPLYYRLNLTSIYTYLQHRFGDISYKTGAAFFILSRTLGATLRLYLVINVLQIFLLPEGMGYFTLAAFVILTMILLYTFKGGVKSIVWTDMLQTTFMLLALVTCVWYIKNQLGMSVGGMMSALQEKGYTQIFMTDWLKPNFFIKQIIGGMFITITMTGLDQEMMQKNISCKNLGDAQKNMVTFSFILVAVNLIFLVLGGVLFLYGEQLNIAHIADGKFQLWDAVSHIFVAKNSDDLFPTIALNYLTPFISILFIIGLISALFPSADGALTALTASFCIDILGINQNENLSEEDRTKTRLKVHFTFAFVFLLFVLGFKILNKEAIIDTLLKIASYTYGPLLGLFMFGILTKRTIKDKLTPYICIASPVICFLLDMNSTKLIPDFKFGPEMLLWNGLLTFLGLYLISGSSKQGDNILDDSLISSK
ncbi:MAG TPA: sodium:solute symporter [Chitinophagales bacterium]|nr:sodium:solute symporter [Chitinophagales bacterium]HNL83873.1 sodium:solute symporter [Chitinophagales bacterium]